MRIIPATLAVATLLGVGNASATTLSAHGGFNPGAAIDAATLGSVQVGTFGRGGASFGDVVIHRTATSGPAGGFTDRN